MSLFLLVSAVAIIQEPVNDANGNPLKRQAQYFIQPVSREKGGGLVPQILTLTKFCPLGIVQTLLTSQPGLPVIISDPFSDKGNISTNIDLNIEFQSSIWTCTSSKIWTVDDSSSSSDKQYVTSGGSSGQKESFFQIQKYGNDQNTYKLVHNGKSVGTTPGLFGAPTLVLNDDDDDKNAFPVKFREVETSTENVFEKSSLRMFPSF
ncbi:hypothetical protein AALP_AA1G293900 [Arabis alpina]|uniref:Uncharacterized protein n=1 Tax=Arabis alpina TaxID=50452 RepID=A0A087HRG5_ARAAL|nr:hypothetical protein AALP_AA1G293900 [Arabis alpina]